MQLVLIVFIFSIMLLPSCNNNDVGGSDNSEINGNQNLESKYGNDYEHYHYLLKNCFCLSSVIFPDETVPEGADWVKLFPCKKKRAFIRVYLFKEQKRAIEFGSNFIKDKKKIQIERSKYSQLELEYDFTVNGPYLFIIRGESKEKLTDFVSCLAGEE